MARNEAMKKLESETREIGRRQGHSLGRFSNQYRWRFEDGLARFEPLRVARCSRCGARVIYGSGNPGYYSLSIDELGRPCQPSSS